MKLLPCLLFIFVSTVFATPTSAQVAEPRYGVGFNTTLSSADGFGIGLRGRASYPVNADVSAAVGIGLTGFVLNGRENADYILDPQLSAIVMLPVSQARANYVLFGAGAYVPVGGNDGQGGPTVHAGLGRAHLLQESSFYYEVDPALVIGRDHVDVAVPVRIGIIF